MTSSSRLRVREVKRRAAHFRWVSVRIVVAPTWVRHNDFQRTATRAVKRLVQAKQGRSARISLVRRFDDVGTTVANFDAPTAFFVALRRRSRLNA